MMTWATTGYPNMSAIDAEAAVATRRASNASDPAPAPSGPGIHHALSRPAVPPLGPCTTHEVRRPQPEQAEQMYEEACSQLLPQANCEGRVWTRKFGTRFGHLGYTLREQLEARPGLFVVHSYQ